MATLLRVPEVAAGTSEAVLSEWLVKEGSAFNAGDPIVVIETEKAVVEVEAESSAVVLRLLVDGDSEVEVGSPMALIGEESELGADIDTLLAQLGVSGDAPVKPAPERRDVPGLPPAPEPETAPAPAAEVAAATPMPSPSPATSTTAVSADATDHGNRVFVSPIARKLLRQAGVDPADVTGTGPNGRVVRRDVDGAVAATKASAPAGTAPETPSPQPAARAAAAATTARSTEYEEIEHTRLRKAVAKRLTASKQEIPHFYVKRTARLEALLTLRSTINAAMETRISVNDFLIRAIAVAHVRVPDANVIWTDDAMRKFGTVDISVAVASERGLVTPVLRGVERSSLSAISRQVREFVKLANAGKLQQKDLEGGSISISNLGMFGVDEFSAIINPPQSAILAIGAGHKVPVVENDEVVVRTVVDLVLSVDHRAIDGALAAQWMAALVDAIENPIQLVV